MKNFNATMSRFVPGYQPPAPVEPLGDDGLELTLQAVELRLGIVPPQPSLKVEPQPEEAPNGDE